MCGPGLMSVTVPMRGQWHQLPEKVPPCGPGSDFGNDPDVRSGDQLPATVGELVGAAAGVSAGAAVELSAGASVGVSVGTAVGAVVGVAVGVAVGPTAFEGTVFSNFVKRFISERADLRIKSE